MNPMSFAVRRCLTSVALLVGLTCAAHAQVPPTIRVAVVPNYPPLEFKDPANGKLMGFDIDLGEALAAKLGVKIAWQETSFDQMLSALQTQRVDMILSGMTNTPARRDAVNFVDYMRTGPQFYVQRARAAEFPSPDALCGKRVGVNRRSDWPNEVARWSTENCAKSNKPAVVVVGTDGSADARMQLRQSRVDAAVQGGETIAYVSALDNNAYLTLAQPIEWRHNGIGIAKTNPQMAKAVGDALNQLIADGTYKAMLTKWGIQAFALQPPTANTQ